MSQLTQPMFIWIPPERTTKWSVKIGQNSNNLTDVTDYVLSGKFSRGVIGEEMSGVIELDNNSENYTNLFQANFEIYFYMDFSDGTTVQWRGLLEKQYSRLNDSGYTYTIEGSHVTATTLDITVTAEYTDATVTSIVIDLFTNYITGFTTTNVQTISTAISIKWNAKPVFDCLLDLMKLADVDIYIDNDKDVHMFVKNSIESSTEAIIWNDSLIELKGLGTDSIDVRNKIIVHGESGGLPVIHTSPDSSSQTSYGTKEKVISDSSIVNETQAENTADAELELQKNPPTKGEAECLFMPTLNPGDKIYVVSPPHQIQNAYRNSKFTFRVPEERHDVIFSQEVSIPQLFKERIKKELSQEKIINPYKMEFSFNFNFDDFTNINQSGSSNITLTDSKLQITSGQSQATMLSEAKTTSSNVTQVHLLKIGEQDTTGVIYEIVADGTENWQTISPDTLTDVTPTGTSLRLRIRLSNTSVLVDSVALLYK